MKFALIALAIAVAILTLPPPPPSSFAVPPSSCHRMRMVFAGDRLSSYLPAMEMFYPGRFNSRPTIPAAVRRDHGPDMRPALCEVPSFPPYQAVEFLFCCRRSLLRSLLP
jgi:hypothetical protein